jgi:transaldolase/glucose-6-phosphate isomerase
MIKIPGTPEGLPAITEATAAGINVNVTLIFSVDSYAAAANAFIAGLEQRRTRGEPIDRIASVNSVFVSRIDTAIDKLLEEKIARGEPLSSLLGKTGVANLQLTYQRFKHIFGGERFAPLRAAGGHAQRPLWASTGTKNPLYSDLLYVENTVARDTVNTVPPATLDAMFDHLRVRPDAIEQNLDDAQRTISTLAQAHISLFEVTEKLQAEGVKLFANSYTALLATVANKAKVLSRDGVVRVELELGKTEASPETALRSLAQNDFLRKLWTHDPSPWPSDGAEIIKNSLGWLDFPQHVLENCETLLTFAREIARDFTHVVVLGMGGSSLAPDVLRATFGTTPGFPRLHVLDSGNPMQIRTLEESIDIARTLFIVASKSGTTTEPDAFMRYFFNRVQKIAGSSAAGQQFIAITDPGTPLVELAEQHGFRRVFLNDPHTGGRYSALTYFGMVPAALAGYDVRMLLDRALNALHGNARTTPVEQADGVRLGAAIASLAKRGRDKLTILTHPKVAAFGVWCEQLIAESTGKNGLGIIPIEGEPLADARAYGNDRIFVYVGEGLDGQSAPAVGEHPLIRLTMKDQYDLGYQFVLWEIATATMGAILTINPFDQPNVQESKDNTKRILGQYEKQGSFNEPATRVHTPVGDITPLSGSANLAKASDLPAVLLALFSQVRPGDYVAITAYIEMNAEHQRILHEIRTIIRDALAVATTVGFGPRFLHSTGQLHKGGPDKGVFLQLTADPPLDLPIPGMTTFKTLEHAQALGDFASLDKRKRRGAHLHFTVPLDQGLATLEKAVGEALMLKVGNP